MTRRPRTSLGVPAARGFTLIELVATLGVMAILMAAMGSILMLVTRGIDPGDSVTVADAAEGVDQLAADLSHATSIGRAETRAIEFVVGDRTGDGVEDTIRIAWGGGAGDPLVRQINGDDGEVLVGGVEDFALSYDPLGQEGAGEVQSAEVTLSSDTGPLTAGTLVADPSWVSQHSRPTMPTGVSGWTVTRARVPLARSGTATGEIAVQLRKANINGTPTASVLSEVRIRENTLTSGYQWRDVTFSGVPTLAPGDGVCLVLVCVSGSPAALCQTVTGRPSDLTKGLATSSNQGSSWTYSSTGAMVHQLYGRYVADLDNVTTPSEVSWVGVRLRAWEGTPIQSAVRLVNRPGVGL